MIYFHIPFIMDDEEVKVRIFIHRGSDLTQHSCGKLSFLYDEWEAFRNKFPASGSVEYIDSTVPMP